MNQGNLTRRELLKLGTLSIAGTCLAAPLFPSSAHANSEEREVIYLNEFNNPEIKRNSDFARAKWAEAVKEGRSNGFEVIGMHDMPEVMPLTYSSISGVYNFRVNAAVTFPIQFWCDYDRQYINSFWTFQEVYAVGANGLDDYTPVSVLYLSYELINPHDSTLAASYNLRLRSINPIGAILDIQQAFYVEFYAYSESLKVFTP